MKQCNSSRKIQTIHLFRAKIWSYLTIWGWQVYNSTQFSTQSVPISFLLLNPLMLHQIMTMTYLLILTILINNVSFCEHPCQRKQIWDHQSGCLSRKELIMRSLVPLEISKFQSAPSGFLHEAQWAIICWISCLLHNLPLKT